MSLVLLALFVAIGVLVSGALFLPLGWISAIHLSTWFWLALLLLPLAWLLGD